LGKFGNVAADFHQAAVHRFLFAFGSRQDFGFDLFQDGSKFSPSVSRLRILAIRRFHPGDGAIATIVSLAGAGNIA
jgi:hypothetical protein